VERNNNNNNNNTCINVTEIKILENSYIILGCKNEKN
jgi:hypothetical protein